MNDVSIYLKKKMDLRTATHLKIAIGKPQINDVKFYFYYIMQTICVPLRITPQDI